MYRLNGFDYSSPYYYMVTLKKREDLAPFSSIVDGRVIESEITRAFDTVIKNFHLKWWFVEPIWCFVIMPDHLHLLIKIADVEKRGQLGRIVYQLMKALALAYWEGSGSDVTEPSRKGPAEDEPSRRGAREAGVGAAGAGNVRPVFERDWHDWIIKRDGQLENFINYIRENPARHWQRTQNRDFFRVIPGVKWLERDWFAYGNLELLKLPALAPFRCSRSIVEVSEEWLEVSARAARIGEDAAGVGTFMSPLEKVARQNIIEAGGNLIILEPQSYAERGHPPREYEKLCAEGRALFLSLWPAETKKLDKSTMYKRCHELGDIAVEGLR